MYFQKKNYIYLHSTYSRSFAKKSDVLWATQKGNFWDKIRVLYSLYGNISFYGPK